MLVADLGAAHRVGLQVALLRHSQGLTQEELAELAGVQQGSISALETGRAVPRFPQLVRIAEELGGVVCVVPDTGEGRGRAAGMPGGGRQEAGTP